MAPVVCCPPLVIVKVCDELPWFCATMPKLWVSGLIRNAPGKIAVAVRCAVS